MPGLPTWSSLGRRERLFAIGAAITLFLVVFDQIIVRPWGQKQRWIRQQTDVLERSLATQRRFLDRQAYVQAEAEQYRPFLRPAGPRDLELANLLKELEALGEQAHVSLGEVKPVPNETSGPYQTYTFDVQYECTLPQWVEWVYLLESSPLLFTIDRGTVSVKEKGGNMLKGSFRITRIAMPMTSEPPSARAEER